MYVDSKTESEFLPDTHFFSLKKYKEDTFCKRLRVIVLRKISPLTDAEINIDHAT